MNNPPVKPFRFWCQHVLPLAYDDSLSYYELLNKVVVYLNEVIEKTNTTDDNVNTLADELAQLKEEIGEYLAEEVEKAVDKYVVEKGLVSSVNGKYGVVTITAEDIGAIPDTDGSVKLTNIENLGADKSGMLLSVGADGKVTTVEAPSGSVTSVNGKEGDVVLNAADVGAVSKVNGQTGEVVLSANNVGAIPNADGSVVNKNLSAGAVTLNKFGNFGADNNGKRLVVQSDGSIGLASGEGGVSGVESVNGKDGIVVLAASDVGAIPDTVGSVQLNRIENLGSDAAGKSLIVGENGVVTTGTISSGVTSVNGETGDVTIASLPNPQSLYFPSSGKEYDGTDSVSIDASDIGAIPDFIEPENSVMMYNGTTWTGGFITDDNVNNYSIDVTTKLWASEFSAGGGDFLMTDGSGHIVTRKLETWNGGNY